MLYNRTVCEYYNKKTNPSYITRERFSTYYIKDYEVKEEQDEDYHAVDDDDASRHRKLPLFFAVLLSYKPIRSNTIRDQRVVLFN